MPLTTRALLDMTGTDRLAELFDSHHDRLFHLALRLCSDREEARDLVQETFLRAARHSGDVAGEPWLVRTLVNLCKDRYRRLAVRTTARGKLLRAEMTRVQEVNPEEAHVARATVQAALARLAPRRRAAIVLCEIEGLPVRDAARLLGVTEVTVRWHLLAARRELAKVLQGERS